MMSRHRPRRRFDDDIRRPQLSCGFPLVGLRPLPRSRHVLRFALWGSLIDPVNDRIDLSLTERHIILEFLHAHGWIDMPRRHLTREDALANSFGPWPSLGIRHEGHRRHRAFMVALLTFLLKNRRHIFRKRDCLSGKAHS